MTRVTQSVQSQAAKIAELQADNKRLRELTEGGADILTLKCGVCLDVQNATDFFINSPCGHCFCQKVYIPRVAV